MPTLEQAALTLDYGTAATNSLLANLSGIAAEGRFVWTVSDEGRTVECLTGGDGRYALHRQIRLDDLIADLPGADAGAELDLESLDIADGRLWLCGSHAKVRAKPKISDTLNSRIRSRPSRALLASAELSAGAILSETLRHVPYSGKGGLRRQIDEDDYLAPFLELPSKENGLDIEGIVLWQGSILLGLRGPVLDSIAVVVHLSPDSGLQVRDHELSFLDLGGLGIRDLARQGGRLVVLAGPTGDASAPYRLYGWQPHVSPKVQKPDLIYQWPESREKPEGICVEPGSQDALIVVYDTSSRTEGRLYRADRLSGI